MTSSPAPEIFRATIFHTPRNAFRDSNALVALEDGALAVSGRHIVACDDYPTVHALWPDAAVHDLRGSFLLPGFIDTHVHYPQVRIIGGFGCTLLDWLAQLTLPEESKLADRAYAAAIAREFVVALASHGTTTALVFGSHFRDATAELFRVAGAVGVRIISGLVVSDRHLCEELHTTPEAGYRDSKALIAGFHGHGRLSYAVTPRFALSTTEPMLEVCRALMDEHPGVQLQSHINENTEEIAAVASSFPWSGDYLHVYERFGLVGRRSVFAHNVHPSDAQLERLASSGAAIAHCPCSNAALGSGVFPMQRHLDAGVRFGLGSDVGGGLGFSLLREALQSYLQQRVYPGGVSLSPGQLLYLATRAGAEALNLDEVTGDFQPGKAADFVVLEPAENSVLSGVVGNAKTLNHQLSALFALAGPECVRQVRVEGEVIFG